MKYPRLRVSIRNKLLIGFTIPLIVVAGITISAYVSSQQLMDNTKWVEHTYDVMRHTEASFSLLKDVENGARGFALTGDDKFLAPYKNSKQQLKPVLDELAGMTTDNPEQQRLIKTLLPLVDERIANSEKVIAARRSGELPNASASFVPLQEGKRVMDSIRIVIAEMQTEERGLLKERLARVETSTRRTHLLIGAGGVTSIIAILAVGLVLGNNIGRSISELVRATEELQEGNFGARVQHTSNDETRTLAEAFNRMAAQLAENEQTLRESNADLEAFTYSVAHDLRAPLRHISGFSKILEEESSPLLNESGLSALARIQQGTRQMGQLVDDLLNLSQVGRRELVPQVAGLKTIVDKVIKDLQRETSGRHIEWNIGELPFLECDPGLMEQVFANLLSNAVKYTRPREQATIAIGQFQENGNLVLFVRDNGVGFSMKYADKLFGIFQRLHRQEDFEGTGVGLATVYRIIRKHGGRIWAESELDRGATFYFTLGSMKIKTAQVVNASEMNIGGVYGRK
jgi:signal transduction histidine kinase